MVTLLPCRCRLDASRGLVVVATWSVGSRLGGQKGGVALHVSCSAVTPGELSVPVLWYVLSFGSDQRTDDC